MRIPKVDRGVSKCGIHHVPVLSPNKALAVSFFTFGKVNIRFMERISDMTEDELTDKLEGKIFFNPISDNYETKEKLLSGDLEKKAASIQRWIDREEKRIKGFPGYDGIEPYIYMAEQSLKVMKSAKKKTTTDDDILLKQYDEMKRKHPDAILLFRRGDFYETFKENAVKTAGILNVNTSEMKAGGKKITTAGFPHQALETYLPKLVRAGMRIAICEALEDPKQKKIGKEENSSITNNTDMAKKKKEETVVQDEPKAKVEAKTEVKTEQKSETTRENKPREPQMVTVNGDKVTHGHAFQSKLNQNEWYFTAKINGEQLKPQKMDPADLAAYQKKEMTVPQLMERYYPTKLMPKVTELAFNSPNFISGAEGTTLTVDKFNVYKEKDETRADYGKYKFYAQVGDKKMSAVASHQDLNAYFDRVMTPGQLVEKNFGERLHLPTHYQQFQLPKGIDPETIRIAKDKADNKWKVSVDLGNDRGRSSQKEISFDDGYSLYKAKTATREQIAAKYLNNEITTRLAEPLAMKASNGHKM